MADKSATQKSLTTLPAHSPLLGLPPELRNRIYEYVASRTTTGYYHVGVVVIAAPGLAAVSRQVRSEYLPVLCHKIKHEADTLYFEVRNFEFEGVIDWLQHMPLRPDFERTADIHIIIDAPWEAHIHQPVQWMDFCSRSEIMRSWQRTYTADVHLKDDAFASGFWRLVNRVEAYVSSEGNNEELESIGLELREAGELDELGRDW